MCGLRGLLMMALAGVSACAPELGPSPANAGLEQTFGEKFFTIACQRVAYTSSLHSRELAEADPEGVLTPVDVSGSRYRLACRFGAAHLPESAREIDPKVATLVQARGPFVQAIDLVFPEDQLSPLQDYMVRLLPLTDDDSFPELIRQAGSVIETAQSNSDLHWALARLDGRIGYRPRPVCLGIIRELLNYPELQGSLGQILEPIAEGGAAHQPFLDLVSALSFELRAAQKVDDPSRIDPIHASAQDRPLRLALDLLLTQHQAFAADPRPLLLVGRDHRGLALVSKLGSGQLPAPFQDSDGDGLADVDGLGRFRTQGVKPPAPFRLDSSLPDTAAGRDSEGRALDQQGQPLYQYLELGGTLLAALARDGVQLLEASSDRAFQLLLGAAGLLGERRPTSKEGVAGEKLSYPGFDTASAPLLDLLHAGLQVLRDPAIEGTLETLKILIRDHESPTARLVGAALDASDRGKLHPEARLAPGSNLYDDLLPILRQIAATPGLIEDLIHGLADRRTRNLGGMLRNYFHYRDVHQLDSSSMKVKNPGFSQVVDRGQPDSGSNRSIQQRLFHIITNTNGMRLCNKENACFGVTLMGTDLCLKKFKACELFEVPNGAVFYMESIARLRDGKGLLTGTPKAHLRLKTENMPGWLSTIVQSVGEDSLLSLATGIEGMSSHPTTEAVNRQMFLDPLPPMLALMMDPAVDIDGHEVRSYHAGTLLAWEATHPGFSCSYNDPCNFYDAFRPVVQAFADHDAEKLFLDLIAVLHRHWPTRNSKTHQFSSSQAADFAWGSGAVTWELLIIELLENGELLDALADLSVVLDTSKLPDGTPLKTALARTLPFLLDAARTPGLTYRSGRDYSLSSDGKTQISGGVSPFYLLADAFAAKRRALDQLAAGADRRLAEAWERSTSDLVDIFLAVEKTGSDHRFVNRRLPGVAEVMIDFLRARLASHRTRQRTLTTGACQSDSSCAVAFGLGSTCKDGQCIGDVGRWLGQELPADIERVLAGPVVARAADFLRTLDGQPAAKRAIYDLARHLVDELAQNAAFRAALTGLADLVQLLLDDNDLVPVAQAVGRALDPAGGLVPAALRFLAPALAADAEDLCDPAAPSCAAGRRCIAVSATEHRCSRETLTRVLRNAWKEQSPGKSPVQTLLDLSTELHRLKPGTGTPYSGPDFAEAFRQAQDFLANTDTGLVKFFEIVKNRCGGICGAER